jgi:hypothetical protein
MTHETILRSASKEVVIGHGRRFCLIGERINPTGRRIFQEQLRAGDFSAIERDVKAQVEGGADVLDINMGVPLTDEPELLAKAIQLVQSLTDLPICIDSSVVEALEAGLSVYQGRALGNSITAEDDRMAAILPLVKKYDAAVIALPNDHDEIPMEWEKRLDLVANHADGFHGAVGVQRVRSDGHGQRVDDDVLEGDAVLRRRDVDELLGQLDSADRIDGDLELVVRQGDDRRVVTLDQGQDQLHSLVLDRHRVHECLAFVGTESGLERLDDRGVDAERHVGERLHQRHGFGQESGLVGERHTHVDVEHHGAASHLGRDIGLDR